MEIDTGDSLPVVQSPYTLPLKHYDWVQQETETLEKSGVIQRSLSRWASPVIVVLKKSAPDEPPQRRLCINYRKVNVLQQEVKHTDKSTGCLSLYPLPKIDEMFSKLGGATMFLTIDLHSGYYTFWTQPGPCILLATDRQSSDGMQQFCNEVLG